MTESSLELTTFHFTSNSTTGETTVPERVYSSEREQLLSAETTGPSAVTGRAENAHNRNSEQRARVQDFRASGFAEKSVLSQWITQIQEDESSSWRIYFSNRGRALFLHVILIGVIFTANLTFTVYAGLHYDSQNGVGTIYEGDRNTIGTLNRWIHLLINVLGTGMLSASNYCMQLQAAPTRADIDHAHQAELHEQNRTHREGQWLDIGVPSLRNLLYVSNWRRVAWALLALSSIPVHLTYNSAFFQSHASNDYTIAVVKDSFVNGSSWNLTTAETNRQHDYGWNDSRVNPTDRNYTEIIQYMQNEVMASRWEEMNISTCFALYNDYFTPQGNAVIFVKNDTGPEDDSLLIYVSIIPRSDSWPKNMWAITNGSSDFVAVSPELPVTTWFLGPKHYEVSHCRAQSPSTITNQCRFEYSPGIMITVYVLNFIKTMVMLCIWGLRKWQDKERSDEDKAIISTLGDAIASFMRRPDPTTLDMCLATKDDFIRRRFGRWSVLLSLCVLTIIVASILLGTVYTTLNHRRMSTTISAFWQLGFGAVTQYTYLVIGLPREDPAGLILNVLLANLPQLIVSILYIFYNAMLSTFLVQLEFSRMYRKQRKTLRVSEPRGIQRSSFFISLPLCYGIPFYLSSALIHWLVVQSLFLARITAICADGSPEYCRGGQADLANSFSTCGYSPIAIITTLIAGALIIIVIVVMGLRTYKCPMSMVSTNSMAISAACHVLPEDRDDAYLLPVQWGVVEITNGVGKCTFTTAPRDQIKLPEVTLRYQ
ncbi:hypothetical protein F4677DRAFT_454255 [Hypoxylon crocopeplum]|nr:hypothetical protein F4677DRAFT_454255 [Hypoxylon crocopeplum]